MKIVNTFAIAFALAFTSIGPCLADITSASGTGTVATIVPNGGSVYFVSASLSYPASVVSDTVSSSFSQIDFTYSAPTNYVDGDRVIIELINGTASTLSNM